MWLVWAKRENTSNERATTRNRAAPALNGSWGRDDRRFFVCSRILGALWSLLSARSCRRLFQRYADFAYLRSEIVLSLSHQLDQDRTFVESKRDPENFVLRRMWKFGLPLSLFVRRIIQQRSRLLYLLQSRKETVVRPAVYLGSLWKWSLRKHSVNRNSSKFLRCSNHRKSRHSRIEFLMLLLVKRRLNASVSIIGRSGFIEEPIKFFHLPLLSKQRMGLKFFFQNTSTICTVYRIDQGMGLTRPGDS